MGFFKAQRELVKQAKEIQKNSPPAGQRMADAQARMAASMQNMAAQTEAANMALTLGQNGTPASVTVTAVQQTGMLNFNAMLQLDVTVMPSDQPPYPASVPLTIPQTQAAFVQPGKTFSAKVDPEDRMKIWIDPLSIH